MGRPLATSTYSTHRCKEEQKGGFFSFFKVEVGVYNNLRPKDYNLVAQFTFMTKVPCDT